MEIEARLNKFGYPFSMRNRCPKSKVIFARRLRNNPTKEEWLLWERLANRATGFRFRRQALILGWIADFFCPACGLVIEVDGTHHRTNPTQVETDILRDGVMESKGFKVIRFSNEDIRNNLENAVQSIVKIAKTRSKSPKSDAGEGKDNG